MYVPRLFCSLLHKSCFCDPLSAQIPSIWAEIKWASVPQLAGSAFTAHEKRGQEHGSEGWLGFLMVRSFPGKEGHYPWPSPLATTRFPQLELRLLPPSWWLTRAHAQGSAVDRAHAQVGFPTPSQVGLVGQVSPGWGWRRDGLAGISAGSLVTCGQVRCPAPRCQQGAWLAGWSYSKAVVVVAGGRLPSSCCYSVRSETCEALDIAQSLPFNFDSMILLALESSKWRSNGNVAIPSAAPQDGWIRLLSSALQ